LMRSTTVLKSGSHSLFTNLRRALKPRCGAAFDPFDRLVAVTARLMISLPSLVIRP
jgi:hypothetical protein